jgi:hypothetical protein
VRKVNHETPQFLLDVYVPKSVDFVVTGILLGLINEKPMSTFGPTLHMSWDSVSTEFAIAKRRVQISWHSNH